MRKDLLVDGQVYHIFTKSIAEFKIFNNDNDFLRMIEVIRYYQWEKPSIKFCKYIKEGKTVNTPREKLLEIIAYCLMPTHLHLILKQLKKNGISIFMSNILNSYTRYFNIKHKRKGPLWEGRFKSILVENDEYLLHLTRYIHLNPVTAGIVEKPESWITSSYNEYLLKAVDRICKYEEFLDIKPNSYKEFVEDRVSYQCELAKIKALTIEPTYPTYEVGLVPPRRWDRWVMGWWDRSHLVGGIGG